MNYYKRHLGDYAKKAGRLSMLQHGSYTLLLDACYDREEFPTLEQAIEWTWASTTEEIEAVTFVLRKFFVLEDGVYVQKRIQEEMAEYHDKAETNKRIALERETKRREKSTLRAPVVHATAPEQHEPPPNHEPLTTNHKPVVTEITAKQPTARGSRLPPDFQVDMQFAVDEGIQNCLEESAKFRDYWNAQPGQKGVKLDWPATWRNWCRNSKTSRTAPAIPTSFKASDDAKARARWEEMTGRIHPDNMVAPKHGGDVIDITPKTLEISQ